jgi:hypothetical protein
MLAIEKNSNFISPIELVEPNRVSTRPFIYASSNSAERDLCAPFH